MSTETDEFASAELTRQAVALFTEIVANAGADLGDFFDPLSADVAVLSSDPNLEPVGAAALSDSLETLAAVSA